MDNTTICKLMESYREFPSEEKRQKLISGSAAYIFSNLKCMLAKPCPPDEDTKSEFLVWLYPQLERIIDNFNPSKAALHTYLSVDVKYRYLRFREENSKRREILEAAENEEKKFLKGYDTASCPDVPRARYKNELHEPGCKPEEKKACCKSYLHKLYGKTDAAKKRMAMDISLLMLKSASYLSEESIDKVSAHCGIPHDELAGLVEAVRSDYSKAQNVYDSLRAQRYGYYLRSQRCSKKIAELKIERGASDREKIRRMEKERDYCDRQSSRLCNKMKKLKRHPSNRYLANLLNMPTGSVSSALARIKRRALKNGDLADLLQMDC